MALLANCHSVDRTFRSEDFDPYAERRMRGVPITADAIDAVVEAFTGKPAPWLEPNDD